MPIYHFVAKRPGSDEGDMVDGEYPDDQSAISDARQAMADMVRDAAREQRKVDQEIEVLNEVGTVIAVITLNGGG